MIFGGKSIHWEDYGTVQIPKTFDRELSKHAQQYPELNRIWMQTSSTREFKRQLAIAFEAGRYWSVEVLELPHELFPPDDTITRRYAVETIWDRGFGPRKMVSDAWTRGAYEVVYDLSGKDWTNGRASDLDIQRYQRSLQKKQSPLQPRRPKPKKPARHPDARMTPTKRDERRVARPTRRRTPAR